MNTAQHAQPDTAAHLSQTELARRWQMSPRSLEKWRTLGIGPAYLKIGGAVRYRTEDVIAYEAAQLRGGR
jgi:hypothetical protein